MLLLLLGDEFALRDGGVLYCKEDHDVLEKTSQSSLTTSSLESNNHLNNSNQANPGSNNHSSEMGSMSGEFYRKQNKKLNFSIKFIFVIFFVFNRFR